MTRSERSSHRFVTITQLALRIMRLGNAMGIIPNDATGNVTRAGNSGHSYVAKFANRKDNDRSTEATLNGFVQLAGQFYSPILAAWGERMRQKRKKKGLFKRG